MKKTTGCVVAISAAIFLGSMIPISGIAHHGRPAPRIVNCTDGWTVTIRLYTERDTNNSIAYKKFNLKGGNNKKKGESKDAPFREMIGLFPDYNSRDDATLKAAARIADKNHPCAVNALCKTYHQITFVEQFVIHVPATLKRGHHYGVYPTNRVNDGYQKDDGTWLAKELGFSFYPLGDDEECDD